MMPALATAAGDTGRRDTHVIVRPCSDADGVRWDAFVAQCAGATFFHRFGWRAIIEEEFRHRTHYLVAERGGQIAGVLPLAQMRSRVFGHALASLPFCVYGGPAANDRDTIDALTDAAEALGQRLGVAHLELRNRQVTRPAWPRQSLYATFRRALASDVESNLLAIPRKQRAMVRKGERHGLVATVDDSTGRFFALFADNVHRHGTPAFSRRYFERLKATFGDACEILTVTDSAGRPVSGVLSFYFRDEVLPYYAGDTTAARELAANDFKYWALMRRACERGLRTFDYGRSRVGTGPYAFKRNWGFVPDPLAYEFRLYDGDTVPQKNPANPRYQAFIAAWRLLPRGVANAVGPMIVRNLG